MLLCMSLWSSTVWAEREKPTISTTLGEAPQDGEVYYLYNVEANQFLCAGNSWGTQASLNDYPIASLTISMGDCSQITFTETGKMLFSATQSSVYTDYNNQDINKTNWSVVSLSKGSYKIQSHVSSPDYTENYYLGWDKDTNTIVGQMEEGALEWIFLKSSGATIKHYLAEMSLYSALQQSVAYKNIKPSTIATYDDVYAHRSSRSTEDLNRATNELRQYLVEENLYEHIVVNLLEPGSLGTEVLYNVNNIKDVKWLKVYGTMNADDWAKIALMKDSLIWLDLSEAKTNSTYTMLANRFFYEWQCLKYVHLPKGLTEIGSNAFESSTVDSVAIPDVEKMDDGVFAHAKNLKVVRLSNKITEIPDNTFRECNQLVSVFGPDNLKTIKGFAFYACGNLRDLDMSNVESIGWECFAGNWNLDPGDLPNLKDLDRTGLRGTKLKKIKLDNIEQLHEYAFSECTQLEEVEFPSKFTNFGDFIKWDHYNPNGGYYYYRNSLFSHCYALKSIKFNAACVVGGEREGMFWGIDKPEEKITIYVPKYLVNYYKQDSFWYKFKIEGFEIEDPENYTIDIRQHLVMNNRERFEGTPSLYLRANNHLKINGENEQTLKNVDFDYNSQIFSNCNDIHVDGYLCDHYNMGGKMWYFISLPFDCVISKTLERHPSVQFAFRYYDGAGRATNGASGNWKNFEANDTIPAGFGFIMQANAEGWYSLYSADNESKQNVFSPKEFSRVLDVNASELPANSGWNLVGNPYHCFYNNHAINFAGPITVWNVNNRTYTAYSHIDDDYAIRPNEAFFVQCPGEENDSISFPLWGRQLTSVIESQSAAKVRTAAAAPQRSLVNVKISNGEQEDQTRVVLNESASLDYELHCDASKMMSMDASVPQIYTLGNDDVQYAINERPTATGIVPLGMYLSAEGAYTLSLDGCDAEAVTLIDYETGTEQSLSDGYTFNAPAGYDNGRFALKFDTAETTGIATINGESLSDAPCYNVAGQRVARDTKGIVIVGGRKIFNK